MAFLIFLIILPSFLFFSPPSTSYVSATDERPMKLIDSVCNRTSDYKFCNDSIYADPRAPKARNYILLAYISFELAYYNSTTTQSYIEELLNSTTTTTTTSKSSTSTVYYKESLKKCSKDYEKAVYALLEACNNLNSETFFDLKDLAHSAANATLHCENGFKKGMISTTKTTNPLSKRNQDLVGLCEICSVIGNYINNPPK